MRCCWDGAHGALLSPPRGRKAARCPVLAAPTPSKASAPEPRTKAAGSPPRGVPNPAARSAPLPGGSPSPTPTLVVSEGPKRENRSRGSGPLGRPAGLSSAAGSALGGARPGDDPSLSITGSGQAGGADPRAAAGAQADAFQACPSTRLPGAPAPRAPPPAPVGSAAPDQALQTGPGLQPLPLSPSGHCIVGETEAWRGRTHRCRAPSLAQERSAEPGSPGRIPPQGSRSPEGRVPPQCRAGHWAPCPPALSEALLGLLWRLGHWAPPPARPLPQPGQACPTGRGGAGAREPTSSAPVPSDRPWVGAVPERGPWVARGFAVPSRLPGAGEQAEPTQTWDLQARPLHPLPLRLLLPQTDSQARAPRLQAACQDLDALPSLPAWPWGQACRPGQAVLSGAPQAHAPGPPRRPAGSPLTRRVPVGGGSGRGRRRPRSQDWAVAGRPGL